MTDKEAMAMALEALEYIDDGANNQGAHTGISWRCVSNKAQPAITSLRQAIAEAEGQEKALQALHAENERLGLYKDAYAEQEPVAWVLLRQDDDGFEPVMFYGGKEKPEGDFKARFTLRPVCFANTTPPQRTEQEPVIDKSAAIRIATALGWEPKREWVGLTDEDWVEIFGNSRTIGAAVRNTEAKLKQKNDYAKENI